MGITLYYIGKDSKNLYQQAENEFISRLEKLTKLKCVRLNPGKNSKSLPPSELQKLEANILRERVPESSLRILLDEKGKEMHSRAFSAFLEKSMVHHAELSFVIGGAYGFSEDFKKESAHKISLSRMTMPHHLARLVLLEQLYRAFNIINNTAYHND